MQNEYRDECKYSLFQMVQSHLLFPSKFKLGNGLAKEGLEGKQTIRAHLILHHWISPHATPCVSRRWPGGNARLIIAVSGAGYNNSTAKGM
jgi:hypothetical protein